MLFRHPNLEMTGRQLGYIRVMFSEEVRAGIIIAFTAKELN